jgi:curved DNA-binding protein CbpA
MTKDRDPAFDAYVMKIHQVLDRLDYYRLLGVERVAAASQVKKAFLQITAKFHPDRHRQADEQIRTAMYDIFKRLNEAYRVLTDPEKKALYDQQLDAGSTRFSTDLRMSMVPRTPEDTIKSREARQFYIQARESLSAGNLLQAELHAKMAHARDMQNPAIAELMGEIQSKKKK